MTGPVSSPGAAAPGRVPAYRLLKNAEDVLFAQDQVLLVVQRHLGARVLAEENPVAGLHVERYLLALVVDLAVADGDHLALLRLLLCGVGDDDPALLRFLLLLALDEEAVMQRTNLHSQIASR